MSIFSRPFASWLFGRINVNDTPAQFTWTPVVWDIVSSSGDGLMTLVAGGQNITIKRDGIFDLSLVVLWNTAGGGYRSARVVDAGSGVILVAAGTGEGAGFQARDYGLRVGVSANQILRIEVMQDSAAVGQILASDPAYRFTQFTAILFL